MGDMRDEKARASGWFRELRDRIVAAFEALEDEGPGDCNATHSWRGSTARCASTITLIRR